MIAELGLFALVLAFAVSAAQAVVPHFGAYRGDQGFMAFARHAAVLVFVLIGFAFLALTISFVQSDFSVRLAAAHSQIDLPLAFKISGVWSNHEGSMLLWVLVLTLFSAAIAIFDTSLPDTLRARVLAIQGLIATVFLAFILFTSNPFARLDFVPPDGNGMNPILQDPGLAFHPPCLYLGYVGFSVTFAFAVAALLEGRVDAAWARWVRPWALAAWCFLTLGITLGSFWAYYTLGWGGWWFWDPVENVSLMPWLSGTALLHSAIVVERRNTFVAWTILLAILTFSFSLIGTFVVRSGVLTSVHAFALDPGRGIFMLAIMALATGGALVLYAWRAPEVRSSTTFAFVSRESGLALNNVFLVTAAATVFIGTFYPLAIDVLGNDKISVGPPYYNRTFVPAFIPLLLLLSAGPFLKWKRDTLPALANRLATPLSLVLVATTLVLVVTLGQYALATAGLALSLWVILGAIWIIAQRLQIGRSNLSRMWSLARSTPRAMWGMALAHLGLGLVVGAITIVSTWQAENITALREGQSASLVGYDIALRKVDVTRVANYEAEQATFDVSSAGRPIATMVAERRFFPVQQSETSHTAIRTTILSNLYVALGEQNQQGQWTVRMYNHPGAPFLWIGGFCMALGGFVSLSDRRFRVGAAAPRPGQPIAPRLATAEAGE